MEKSYEQQAAQYRHEYKSWLRALDFLQQENNYLKKRLAVLLKAEQGTDLLAEAELFQNVFVNKDAVITLMKHDIRSHTDELNKMMDEEAPGEAAQAKHQSLRNDMKKIQCEFSSLQFKFCEELCKHLGIL